jgi:dephospho-CoA kinase
LSATRRPAGQLRVGLTGGIGSGKSTVAGLLAEHGAYVIDADVLARTVLEPGTPGLAEVVTRFGPRLVQPDGTLDRAALARVVFADPAAREALNAIVHPRVAALSQELMAAAGPDRVVIYDVPLLAEVGRADEFDAVVVVTAPEETRLARLVQRGLDPDDARRRIGAQASDEQRAAIAWHIVDNDGDRAVLREAVRDLWARIEALRAARQSV